MSFLSLIVWGFILGPIGEILAVPASLLFKALLVDVDPDAKWLQLFLGDEPVIKKKDPDKRDVDGCAARAQREQRQQRDPTQPATTHRPQRRRMADRTTTIAHRQPPIPSPSPEPGKNARTRPPTLIRPGVLDDRSYWPSLNASFTDGAAIPEQFPRAAQRAALLLLRAGEPG